MQLGPAQVRLRSLPQPELLSGLYLLTVGRPERERDQNDCQNAGKNNRDAMGLPERNPGDEELLGEFEEEHDREQGGKNQGKYPVQSPGIICVAHEVREKLLVPAR